MFNASGILKQLNCPLLGNGEELWINELLFTPSSHRFQLLDWIFSRLEFFDCIESKNGQEQHPKEYLAVLCAMGICRDSDKDLVKGNASKPKQLKFWKKLLGILEKAELFSEHVDLNDSFIDEKQTGESEADECQSWDRCVSDEHENFFIQEKSDSMFLENAYNRSVSIISQLSSEVSVNDLFSTSMSLFPPDMEKDADYIVSKNKTEVEKLPQLKGMIEMVEAKKNEGEESGYLSGFLISMHNSNPSMLTEELEAINCEKIAAANEFQNIESQFGNAYDELKPVLRSSNAVYTDVGLEFEKVHPKMELLSKLLAYLGVFKSTCFKLEEELKNLRGFDLSHLGLTGSDLDNYICILQKHVKK